MELWFGCAMWRLRSWAGRYLPARPDPAADLAAYASWCTAVEGNTTFYALPDPASVDRWREATPERFRFLFKLPRTITHDRRLRQTDAELDEFCARMRPLGPRLGPVSVQLPGSFGPADLPVLTAFLDSVPGDFSRSVEVRHPRFHDGGAAQRELNDMLHARGVDRVLLDTRALFAGPRQTPAEHEAFEQKPRLPVRPIATADHPVVRFIGQSHPAANPEFWAPWVDRVIQWLVEGREPTVFIHTPDNAIAPELVRAFHAEVSAGCDSVNPPPPPARPEADLADTQARLF